jgi:hypothetical protein
MVVIVIAANLIRVIPVLKKIDELECANRLVAKLEATSLDDQTLEHRGRFLIYGECCRHRASRLGDSC